MSTIGQVKEVVIERRRGDTKPLLVTLKEKDTGALIDVAGFSALWTAHTVKAPVDNTTQVFQIMGVLDTPTTDGRVLFNPLDADVDQDPTGKYYYDIQVTDASGKTHTDVKGELKFSQDLTK